MKKITFLFIAVLLAASSRAVNPTITTEWEKSASNSNLPYYIYSLGDMCRGMGLGTFNSKKVLAVASRKPSALVRIIDASTGDSINVLNCTGISGGAIVLNDAAITTDGKILASNVVNAVGSVLKIYQWNNTTDAPTVAISYALTEASRYGDHITVTGSISDGTAKVYCASSALVSGVAKIIYFSMISDGNGGYVFNSTPNILSSGITAASSLPSIDFLPNGQFIHKGNGANIRLFNADGTSTGDASSTATVATGGTSVKYLTTNQDTTYLAYFRYGTGFQCASIIKLKDGTLANAVAVCNTPALGSNSNGNGAGRICVEKTESGLYLYVLSTNNGIGKYKISFSDLTGIGNTEVKEIGISVNNGFVIVNGVSNASIELYNILGQKIKSIRGSNELCVNDLRGVYVVRVKSEGHILKTGKIAIQ